MLVHSVAAFAPQPTALPVNSGAVAPHLLDDSLDRCCCACLLAALRSPAKPYYLSILIAMDSAN